MRKEKESEIIDLAVNYMSLYGINVNMARAIPFIKDGIKPIARRILYAIYKFHNDRFVKTSVLIGDIGKFSPHGEQGLNEIIAKLAQPFTNNVPYIKGDGNVGNETTGDDFAAARYYEVALSKFAMDVFFKEFDGKVNMMDSYDGNYTEPITYPARFPTILLNGTSGIGYTLSCNIPPYNLSEIADATIKVIKYDMEFRKAINNYVATHKNDSLSEFLQNPNNVFNSMTVDPQILKTLGVKKPKIWLVPDSPTGCDIIVIDHERFIMQSSYDIDNVNYIITIRNTPYMKFLDNLDKVLRQIQDSPNPIPELLSAEEDSENMDEKGISYTIRCKPCNLNAVANTIFKRIAGFRTSVSSANMTVIDSSYRTKKFNCGEILGDWISQRFVDKRGWFLRELVEKNTVMNMLEGKAYMLSAKNIERTIAVFKNAKTRDSIIPNLVAEYKGRITTSQAAYISELKLYQLNAEEFKSTKDKILKLQDEIDNIRGIVSDDDRVKDQIIEDIKEIKQKYGTPRRSKIINTTTSDVASITVVNILTSGNVVFSDVIDPQCLSSSSIPVTGNKVCLIDEFAHFIWVNIGDIPRGKEFTLTSIGQHKMGKCITAVSNPDNNVIVLTNYGNIKMLPISIIPNNNKSVKSLIETGGEEVVVAGLEIRDESDDVLIYTNDGMGKRVSVTDIPRYNTLAGKGKRLVTTENVSGMFTLNPNKPYIIYITRLGRMRVNQAKYLATGKRYDDIKPLISLSTTDDLVGVFCCDQSQTVTLYHMDGKISNVEIQSLGVSTINTPPQKPRKVPGVKVIRTSIS